LGRLFTHSADVNDQLNIVIMLTPYIVNSSDELSALRAQLAELDGIQDAYSKQLKDELEKRVVNKEEPTSANTNSGSGNAAIDNILNGGK
jgi:type II secretory pathway component GspD/PulD (secretin)